MNIILHLCVNDKFIKPFYDFMKSHFSKFYSQHLFYINGSSESYEIPQGKNVYLAQNHHPLERYAWLIKNMNDADKIILHGLWNSRVLQLLTLQPWLLKKCYWVIWGGDLYTYQLDKRTFNWWKLEVFRRFTIKRFGHFITYIKGDYELARKWYGANGQYHECFMYPSNLYKDYNIKLEEHDTINIQVGNSATYTNEHVTVLEKLVKYKDKDIKIYVPLSYGDKQYANTVIEVGKNLFGNKFIPLLNFMPFQKYLDFLAQIDIAIFAHKRQQAMGNTITLLGLGKKVYMRSNTTQWKLFEDIGVTVFDIADINLELIDKQTSEQNKKKIKEYFSEDNYLRQLRDLYE